MTCSQEKSRHARTYITSICLRVRPSLSLSLVRKCRFTYSSLQVGEGLASTVLTNHYQRKLVVLG